MARNRQLNVRLTEGEVACLEAIRGRRQSQADLIAELAIRECERLWHEFGRAGDEEGAAPFADALWILDHEQRCSHTGRPPRPPRPSRTAMLR
jgi:hypothetical protein